MSEIRNVILLFVFLTGCTQEPPITDKQNGTISEISFFGAHEDVHCSKGCFHTKVPDKWFLNLCDVNKSCYVFEITHAPWEWQKKEAKITMNWKKYSWDDWFVDSFDSGWIKP